MRGRKPSLPGMTAYICVTCGAQFAESNSPPPACPVCEDARQYVPEEGQRGRRPRSCAGVAPHRGARGRRARRAIGMEPSFAIGQRALLVPHGERPPDVGLHPAARRRGRGGRRAPRRARRHRDLAPALLLRHGRVGAPVRLPGAPPRRRRALDHAPRPAVELWEGETKELGDGLTLIRCGGHFAGGTVLHWAAGADGRGALLSGDIVQVIPDRAHVGFMYSYPNLIPLPAAAVARIAAALEPVRRSRRSTGRGGGGSSRATGRAPCVRSAERYGAPCAARCEARARVIEPSRPRAEGEPWPTKSRRFPTTTPHSSRTSTRPRCGCTTTSTIRPTSTRSNAALEGTDLADNADRGRAQGPRPGARGQAHRGAQQRRRSLQPLAVLGVDEPGRRRASPTARCARRSTAPSAPSTTSRRSSRRPGVNQFGSGWSWLVHDGSGLAVVSTPNQDNPVSNGQTPLLGVDVWEHAYYLKYQNKRPDYIDAWWNTVDWAKVAERYSAAGLKLGILLPPGRAPRGPRRRSGAGLGGAARQPGPDDLVGGPRAAAGVHEPGVPGRAGRPVVEVHALDARGERPRA